MSPKRALHSTPNEVGANTSNADVEMLVLSHVSREEVTDLKDEISVTTTEYDGPIVVTRDLLDIYPDRLVVGTEANPETGMNTDHTDNALFYPNTTAR